MRERIKEVMSRTFDIPVSDISDDAKINDIPNWDSLGHMLLMLELEAEFDVSISTDDMTILLSLDLLDTYLQGNGLDPGAEGNPRQDQSALQDRPRYRTGMACENAGRIPEMGGERSIEDRQLQTLSEERGYQEGLSLCV